MATIGARDPVEEYAGRARSADALAEGEEWRVRWLSWLRLGAVSTVVLAIGYGTRGGSESTALVTGIIATLAFVALVVVHRRVSARAARARATAAACRAGIARSQRDWPAVPASRLVRPPGGPNAAARDLDVFGDVSLFRLLDVSAPALGGTRVVEWLLADPADLSTITARQQSVADLRSRLDFLLNAALVGRHGLSGARALSGTALSAFTAWCDRAPDAATSWHSRRRLALGCTALIVALVALQQSFLVPFIMALVVILLALSAAARRHLTATLAGLGSLLPQLRGLDASIGLIAGERDVAGDFGEVQLLLRRDGATSALRALDGLLHWNDMHLTPAMHWPLNAVLGVDVHLAAALEHWRARHGVRVREWCERTADAQALTALATLGHDNPGWVMPDVSDEPSQPAYDAEQVAHPLIVPAIAVPNPVHLGSQGSLLALSGSNMSGKTTYLRAIGLNAALAFAGGPVGASSMRIRRARVRTSVRVEDDLAAGVSLFLAEISRLRDIVRDSEVPYAAPVLFLFDEILHGTNAADRRFASQVVLRRLLHGASVGVLTTHDPDLVTDLAEPEHGSQRVSVAQGHFRETVERDGEAVRMTFDYLLRSGPATSANARLILEQLGLGLPS